MTVPVCVSPVAETARQRIVWVPVVARHVSDHCTQVSSLTGADSVAVRAVPAETDALDVPAMVEEICEKLRKNASLPETDALDDILHTVACKAAIKAGWKTDEKELEAVARVVLSGDVRYCPHGRPVSFTLTKKQLDKEFSRIV